MTNVDDYDISKSPYNKISIKPQNNEAIDKWALAGTVGATSFVFGAAG